MSACQCLGLSERLRCELLDELQRVRSESSQCLHTDGAHVDVTTSDRFKLSAHSHSTSVNVGYSASI